jgi:putative transcriptional regulator
MPTTDSNAVDPMAIDWDALDTRDDAQIGQAVADDPDAAPLMDERTEAAILAQRARKATGLTQATFAQRFGLAVATVRDWEQGRHPPGRVARALLTIIRRQPEVAMAALAADPADN